MYKGYTAVRHNIAELKKVQLQRLPQHLELQHPSIKYRAMLRFIKMTPRGTMTHDDMLMENNFQDVVNSEIRDDQMYDEIRSIRADSEDMISSMIATVQRHVSEVWSPPRLTGMVPSNMLPF